MLQHKPFFFLLAYGESTLSCCCSQRPEKKNVVSTQDEGQIRTTLLKFISLDVGKFRYPAAKAGSWLSCARTKPEIQAENLRWNLKSDFGFWVHCTHSFPGWRQRWVLSCWFPKQPTWPSPRRPEGRSRSSPGLLLSSIYVPHPTVGGRVFHSRYYLIYHWALEAVAWTICASSILAALKPSWDPAAQVCSRACSVRTFSYLSPFPSALNPSLVHGVIVCFRVKSWFRSEGAFIYTWLLGPGALREDCEVSFWGPDSLGKSKNLSSPSVVCLLGTPPPKTSIPNKFLLE